MRHFVRTCLLALLWLLPTAAWANSITFNLTVGNGGINPPTAGPYATVTVNVTDASHATLTFDTYPGFLLAGQGAIAFNLAETGRTIALPGTANASNTDPNFTTPGPVSFGGSNNEDGFGSFNITYDSFDGFQHSSTEISLAVVLLSGPAWDPTNPLGVLTPNSGGSLAAAHIFVCDNPTTKALVLCDGNTTEAQFTGYAAGNGSSVRSNPPPPPPVPEPASLVMLSTGLLGFAHFLRRRK